MLRNAAAVVFVVVFNLIASATTAMAAADPTKIGKNLEDIVSPNVKSFWKIGVLVAVLAIVFGRLKASIIAAVFVCIVASGAIIWNPDGLASMVNSVGDKVF